jgi:hypothetical protein
MRAANQAMLLGIIQSEDQFAELAQAARRLGRAIGRDPLMALNDLTLGIGRQSWRILDNIGIIVKVEQAYKDYAKQLNVTTRDLSDFEKRQAFLVATTEAVRRKLQELGPDVLTATDKFNQLGATLANVFSKIGRLIVGGGSVFTAIDNFLKRNEKAILAYVNAFRKVLVRIFNEVTRFIRRLSSGELQIGEVIGDIIQQTLVLLREGLVTLTEFILRATVRVIGKLPVTLLPAVGAMMFELQIQIFKAITDLFIELVRLVLGLAGKAIDFFGRFLFGKKLLRKLGLDGESLSKAFDGIAGFAKDAKDLIPDALSDAFRAVSAYGIQNTVNEIGAAFNETTDSLKRRFGPAIQDTSTVLGTFVQILRQVKKELDFELRGFPFFRKELNRLVSLFNIGYKAVNKLIKSINKLDASNIDKFNAKFQAVIADFEKELTITPELDVNPVVTSVRELSLELQKLYARIPAGGGTALDLKNDLSRITKQMVDLPIFVQRAGLEFQRAVQDINTEINSLLFDDVTAEMQRVRNEATMMARSFDTLRHWFFLIAKETIRDKEAFKEFKKAIDSINNVYPKFIENVQRNLNQLQKLRQARVLGDAIAQFKDLAKELEDFGLTPVQTAIRDTLGVIDELKASIPDLQIALAASTSPLQAAGNAVSLVSTRGMISDLSERVEEANLNEKLLNFKKFTADVSNSLFTGVAQAFARGEDLGKVWSSFLAETFERAMRDTIERLSTFISNVLAEALKGLGLGSGAAGIVTGLLGLAAGILSRLESQRQVSVDDFESAINSSEAIRGVVAGPTNVAIAEVGDQLKTALRQTELFLERIANAVEGRPFSVSTAGIGDPGIAIRTSGATAT